MDRTPSTSLVASTHDAARRSTNDRQRRPPRFRDGSHPPNGVGRALTGHSSYPVADTTGDDLGDWWRAFLRGERLRNETRRGTVRSSGPVLRSGRTRTRLLAGVRRAGLRLRLRGSDRRRRRRGRRLRHEPWHEAPDLSVGSFAHRLPGARRRPEGEVSVRPRDHGRRCGRAGRQRRRRAGRPAVPRAFEPEQPHSTHRPPERAVSHGARLRYCDWRTDGRHRERPRRHSRSPTGGRHDQGTVGAGRLRGDARPGVCRSTRLAADASAVLSPCSQGRGPRRDRSRG